MADKLPYQALYEALCEMNAPSPDYLAGWRDALEAAAKWHDERAAEADARAERAQLVEGIRRNNLTADMHEASATAIRALKETPR